MSVLNEMMSYTFTSKYARWLKGEYRREDWREAVDRVKDMMFEKYRGLPIEDEVNLAYDSMFKKKVLGSQRALQYGGVPMLKNNARTYNCTSSYCDRLRFFQEAFWLLLCGSGVGFSVQKHHVAKLPEFRVRYSGFIVTDSSVIKTFQIPDTIEGWADALGVLLTFYFGVQPGMEQFAEYVNCDDVQFDYSLIRPKGSPLSSGVGKAPGPEGLKLAMKNIKSLLATRILMGHTRLRPIDAYDIVMHASDAVLSGGVRRSATIAIFSPDDMEMARAKTGNWMTENPQRGRSNNSALLLRNKTSLEQFEALIENTRQWGEPGFVWADDPEANFNPCFAPDTRIHTHKGLIKIKDMCGDENLVLCDTRVGKDIFLSSNMGTELRTATKAFLTQVNVPVFKVTTSHGYSVTTTNNHTFITTKGRKKLKDLQIGDSLPLQSDVGSFGDKGTYNQGLILGLITGDGTICKEEAFIDIWEQDFESSDYIKKCVLPELQGIRSLGKKPCGNIDWFSQGIDKKRLGGTCLYRFLTDVLQIENPKSIKDRIPECVWAGSREFVEGFLAGVIFTDGSVQLGGHKKKSTLSVRINQSNKFILEEIQQLLQNFGIVSTLYERREEGYRSLPDGRGGEKDFFCKKNYDLIINRPNSITLEDRIFVPGIKGVMLTRLLDIRGRDCRKPERYISKVVSIEPVGTSDVYCLTEDVSNSVIANGIAIGQCVEINFWCYLITDQEKYNKFMDTYDGNGYKQRPEDIGLASGWQGCNLSTINVSSIKDFEDFKARGEAAAIIGTLQAGFTDFPYLGPVSEAIFKREALLGVSMTGVMEKPEIVLNEDNQRRVAEHIVEVNKRVAAKIGINAAARTTCLKPEGTTSCLLGTSSGIHPHHAKRYLRRMQANKQEVVYQFFKASNPLHCEESVWSSSKSDDIVTFPIEVPDGSKLKNQLSALELLAIVKLTQINWVGFGTNLELCTQPWLQHNVSNTITVKPEEWDEVTKYIYDNRQYFCGISLLPQSGDKDYPQAPFVAVLTTKEIVKEYGDCSIWTAGLISDALEAFDENLWSACKFANDNDWKQAFDWKAETPEQFLESNIKSHKKIAFLHKMIKFANKYMDGDIKKLTYCMKDVYNWKLYCDLKSSLIPVDYQMMIETEDNTVVSQTVACAGGACENPLLGA